MAAQIFLLDGYAMLYRAHFAFIRNPLINSKGENTSAIFGLTLQIGSIVEECSPAYMAVALDTPKPTFRDELFADYKATREKMPEELREQIPTARELLEEGFCIPILEVDGYEADDVIGTLARKVEKMGMESVIVSGDKDFYQLINHHTKLYNRKGRGEESEWVGVENASERLGVPPEKTVDFLALMGDSADNVPGVRGVGKVAARKLLENYASLDDIYEHLEQIMPEGLRRKLADDRENAFLSRELVTIRTDVDVELDLEAFRMVKPDIGKLAELFNRLEFRTLKERYGIREYEEKSIAKEAKNYRLVDSLQELENVARQLRAAGKFAVDVETTSLDPMEARLVGISLSCRPDEGWYVPIAHTQGPNLELERVREILNPLLADETIGCVGQNIKYDLTVLSRHGMEVAGIAGDPMIASYLLDPGRRSHKLEALAESVLDYRMISYEEVTGKGKDQVTFDKVGLEQACRYSAEDADITLILDDRLSARLEQEELAGLYRDVELPLIPVLARMEINGVAIDVPYLEELSKVMEARLAELERSAFELAGHEFNVNSTQQLAHVLFDEIGIKPGKKTKTGFSTDSTVLAELAASHDLPGVILQYRETAKLKSTYVDALPRQVNPRTGRIHTSFNQVVAATGRLSSTSPNLQNIPVRTEEGRKIRRGFIPGGKDRVLLCADYSQIELRVLAHLSGDESMIEAFTRGVDIHTETASRLFRLAPEEISVKHRSRAKTINFGVLYGMGAHRLSRELKIPFNEARRFIEDYFDRFPLIRQYIEHQVDLARQQGWVSTIIGRKRKLPEISSVNRMQRQNSERMALNTPIQGSAADLIKVAMIEVDRKIREKFPEAKMIIQVHDELVFDVPESRADDLGELVRDVMENAVELKVPVRVDLSRGKNWLECK